MGFGDGCFEFRVGWRVGVGGVGVVFDVGVAEGVGVGVDGVGVGVIVDNL